ncbi:MAG TPA: mechanosensitive ion channel domain-containing protein [Thermoplasmata archaeon]|nr:mechanosensitive ion channel domain-containing protein [Thermoplasmata archaeon]
MNQDSWRKARALLWVLVTLLFVVGLLFVTGTITIPGLPPPQIDLSAYRDWVFVILILLATKALLELLRPLFRSALRSHVRYEADIFSHFKSVSYAVWATALVLVLYILIGSGLGQSASSLISVGIVGGALVYVMGEPLLALVGWIVLVTMRIYKLGDRIEINTTRGYVVGITPLNTTVREFGGTVTGDIHTGRYVTIPNSQILRGNVFNATKDTPFVWDQITITVPYTADAKAGEALLLDAAEDIVGPMMRENTGRIRDKYEFEDLREYVVEEPVVLWNVREAGVDLTLVYFCPVFERGQYRTRLVKNILERSGQRPDIRLSAPAPAASPPLPTPR